MGTQEPWVLCPEMREHTWKSGMICFLTFHRVRVKHQRPIQSKAPLAPAVLKGSATSSLLWEQVLPASGVPPLKGSVFLRIVNSFLSLFSHMTPLPIVTITVMASIGLRQSQAPTCPSAFPLSP